MNGIDVSRWQGKIDWERVKKSGVDFAFIKVSQGGSLSSLSINPFTDSYFKSNITEAAAAGIRCGVYHYLTGCSQRDAEAEAEYMLGVLEPHKSLITFPVALDFEDSRYIGNTKAYNASLVCIFTERVKNAGYTPLLYANRSFLNNHIDMSAIDIDIWYARYYTPRSSAVIPSDLPEALIKRTTVWQWSDSGNVDGVSGKVDMNIGFFDYSKGKMPLEEPQPAEERLSVGDTVEIKRSAVRYHDGGAVIPVWVKEEYDHIITADTYYRKPVFKGGSRCVLLGKKVSRKTGKTVSGINTWIAEENIVKSRSSLLL